MPEIGECYSISDKIPEIGKVSSIKVTDKGLKYIIKGNIELSSLKGGIFQKPFSYGKSVLFPITLKNKKAILCSQLGMTGSWFINEAFSERGSDHIIIMGEKFKLRYSDPRMFGKMKIYSGEDFGHILKDIIKEKKWGIDPLQSSEKEVFNQLKKLSGKSLIKNKLLEQNLIFGIGNYLASEILFDSRISPLRECDSLSDVEFMNIAKSTKKICLLAKKKRGFSFAGGYILPDGSFGTMKDHIQMYGKDHCPTCTGKVSKEYLKERITYFCKNCQK